MNSDIAREIQAEQSHGRQKYGGDARNLRHDDRNTIAEWARWIKDHAEGARAATPMECRQHLIKVAGLAVSAVEAMDRRQGKGD